MPKTAPVLRKSMRVVVSRSPPEYERWERIATEHELRVPEFVRLVMTQAIRNDEKAQK